MGPYRTSPRRLAPGPQGHFLLGDLPEFGRDLLGFFTRCAQEYGDVVSLRLARWRACLINHPDYFEYVLVSHHRNFIKHTFFFRHVTRVFGRGLLTSEGDFWRRQRQLVGQAFHRDRVASHGRVMVRYTDQMLADWRDGESRDMHREMMLLTMRIAAKALFDFEIRAGHESELGRILNRGYEEIAVRFRRPFKISDRLPLPGNVRYRRAVRELNRLVNGIIEQRRKSQEDRGDLVSRLMAARGEDGSALSNQQLRDEIVTIFSAGHETTALALSWTWVLLSQHPQVEAKLVAELKRVLGGRSPTVDDLPQLAYAKMIVSESLRLYPPAYAIGREAVVDCRIGGYDIPRGTTVFISPWVAHRDERFFDHPEAFEPERWQDGFAKRLPRLAYLPFGGGPRTCVGNSFATMEAALLLAAIAQRFRFTLAADQSITPLPSITLRPKSGLRMLLSAQ